MGKKRTTLLYVVITVLVITGVILIINSISKTKTANEAELESQAFLETKSTNEYYLGCGPPDDFDCGVNRYSGYMALSNIEAFEKTNDEKFLDYAIKFATTQQTNPPEWCVDCICLPPDDFDCGTGEVQNEMILVFAKLYIHTGDEVYLDYAEKFASTKPTSERESCTDCICGPPDDFDCGETYVQTGYYFAYNALYDITKDEKYYNYMLNLADSWIEKTAEEKGPRIITMYLRVYELTNDEKYLTHANELMTELIGEGCGQSEVRWEKWRNLDFDESAFLDTFFEAYDTTQETKYLECSKDIIKNGEECSDYVCASITQQASVIKMLAKLYTISGDKEFLDLAEEFAKKENIESVNSNFFGYDTKCEGYDCHDAEDNAFISSALMELEKAKN